MKKGICLATMALILFLTSASAQDKLSASDYERADGMLSWNVAKLVDRMNVNPTWMEDGSFWYRNLVENGKEYVIFNPKTGERKVINDASEIPESPIEL